MGALALCVSTCIRHYATKARCKDMKHAYDASTCHTAEAKVKEVRQLLAHAVPHAGSSSLRAHLLLMPKVPAQILLLRVQACTLGGVEVHAADGRQLKSLHLSQTHTAHAPSQTIMEPALPQDTARLRTFQAKRSWIAQTAHLSGTPV